MIKTLLNQPYPVESDTVGQFFQSLRIGFFIFLFLYIFKPFGLNRSDDLLIHTIYFGAATTIVSFLYDLLLDYVLRIDRRTESWTFIKWIINSLILVALIAVANYGILVLIYSGMERSFTRFLEIAFITLLVGLFPIVFIGSIYLNGLKRKNEKIASAFEEQKEGQSDQSISIKADEKQLQFKANVFIYAEAMQNYVAIYFLKDEKLQKEILRLTLKSLEKQLLNHSIVRCHRSFIVNKNYISSVGGNAQGLKLDMQYVDKTIPVSRSYLHLFR